MRGLDDEPQLGDLFVVADRVAFDGRGKAALRRQADLLERHVLARLIDAALEIVLALQRAALRGHQAKNDHLARRYESQRCEVSRPRVVVFEEKAVDAELPEQGLRDEVVAARRRPR